MRMAYAHGITPLLRGYGACPAAPPRALRSRFSRIGPEVDCHGTLDESLPNIQHASPAVAISSPTRGNG